MGVGINTRPGKVDAIITQLLSISHIQHIATVTGRYDLMVWTACKMLEDGLNFISKELGSISDILNVDTILVFRVVKSSWTYFGTDDHLSRQNDRSINLNEIDRQLIREMEVDPRQSITKLANQLDMPMSSVNKRLRRLISKGVIKVISIPNPTALG